MSLRKQVNIARSENIGRSLHNVLKELYTTLRKLLMKLGLRRFSPIFFDSGKEDSIEIILNMLEFVENSKYP